MGISRKHNWEQLLAQFIKGRHRVPFVWGCNDCCTFSADAILTMTDVDLAADYRGKYSDEATANAAMQAIDHGGVEEVVTRIAAEFNLEARPSWKFAQRGDLVLFEVAGLGSAIGIVAMDGRSILFPREDGLARLPIACTRKAWRI